QTSGASLQEGEVLALEAGLNRAQLRIRERIVEWRLHAGRVGGQLADADPAVRRASCLGRRKDRIGVLVRQCQLIRADEIKRWIDGIDTKLLRGVPVRSRRAIGVHDTARQKIAYALAMLGCVSSVDIIEGAVLADQHDHVLDRRRRLYAIGV